MKIIILIPKDKLKKNLKTAILISPIIMAVFYITLNFIHLTPPNPLTKNYKYNISQFMSLHLPQGWNLFAPNPSHTSIKLLMRCRNKNNWLHWFDPVEKFLKKHYQSRFSSNMVVMKQHKQIGINMHKYIVEQTKENCTDLEMEQCQKMKKIIDESKEKKLLLAYVNFQCLSKFKESDKFEYKLIEIHPKPYSIKDEINKFSKIDIILQGVHEI